MALSSTSVGRAFGFGITEIAFLTVYAVTVLLIPRLAIVARLTSVATLCALTYALQITFFQWCDNPHWRGFAAASLPVQFLSASEIIWHQNPPLPAGKTAISRVVGAISLLWNMRRIGTKWQVPNVKTTFLTRAQFLRCRLATTFVTYIILDAFISAPAPAPSLITSDKQSLLFKNMSSKDIAFRIIGSVSYWFTGFLYVLVVSNLIAIALVATGLSSPSDRPQLFGSVKDSYTLRNFWGVVWHSCLRSCLISHADFVADKILRFPRGTLLSRYTRIFSAFLISGIIHAICERGMGVSGKEGGGLVFFPAQALGIMLEDGAQWVAGSRSQHWRLRQIIGYIWVVAFLSWASPAWFYPHLRAGNDPGSLLPVRAVNRLLKF
ncbi:uncharacterized protein K452DRAFT_294505 [Aplosporella prunicola CBS 121167]|uniref:Wax synthase domain-containing protein n=1 Tax=Aplosporella prunicola CBS 121167 TaxID=1176127 RepID=A0A6A6BWB0_9PEZI|nr:uncharacterized protein K452DRAFT_294505 [Aplosporella prunicola CBS 121167]KAF2146991.1 hypothetical protein K452DRAFT_294505 [Aplosporella prunicola CBS 121167]